MSNETVNYVCVCFQEKCYKVCIVRAEQINVSVVRTPHTCGLQVQQFLLLFEL